MPSRISRAAAAEELQGKLPWGPQPSSTNRPTGRAFGAVYEHRDCFGKPKFVGSTTDRAPEEAFVADARQHQAVRNMLVHQGGQSNVVWAGAGDGRVLGPQEMQTITQGIVARRAKKLEVEKLRSIKPYSRHGF